MRAPAEKWSARDSGEHYAGARFASERASQRDPRLVELLLRRHGARGTLLDAPCGSGRLHGALSRVGEHCVSLDISDSMLAAARASTSAALVRGDVARLPFRDRAFDAVVCCRLLHHLHEPGELAAAVAELVRVSRRLVIASFWDSASLPALRVRLGLKRSEGPRGRRAWSRAAIERALADAGTTTLEFRSTLRFVAQQTFVVAERVR